MKNELLSKATSIVEEASKSQIKNEAIDKMVNDMKWSIEYHSDKLKELITQLEHVLR